MKKFLVLLAVLVCCSVTPLEIQATEITETENATEEIGTELETETEEPLPVVYAVSANNAMGVVDCKHSTDKLQELWTYYRTVTDGVDDKTFDKVVPEGQRVYTNDDIATKYGEEYVVARSYLIENGIVERPASILLSDLGFSATRLDGSKDTDNNYNWLAPNLYATKSDVYMMMHKAVYGSIDSRVLDYGHTIENGDSVNELYTTTSVYEQYLQSLLEKGILGKNELIAGELTSNDWDAKRVWSSSAGMVGLLPSVSEDGSVVYNWTDCTGVFGSSFDVVSVGGGLSITPRKPNYFANENMTLIDLLTVIQSFMKGTEKEVTDTEARIVAYKYGVEYLSELTEEEYNIVAFLIAKGIINFEDYNSLGFFETVTWKDVIPLIYRVANPDARYNFSIIQLTDGEAFWQEKGFNADSFNLTVESAETKYLLNTVSVEEESTEVGWLERIFNVNAVSGVKKYSVVKDFDTINSYSYKGIKTTELLSLYAAGTGDVAGCPEIVKVSETTVDGISVIRVQFNITAVSSTRAVQMVDDSISATIKDTTAYKVSGVIRIVDGKEVRMISQSVIKKCFGDKIDFIEDKVLYNVENGSTACLLQESGYALVGNQVFVDENLLVTDSKRDVYYNFDVISSLLGMSVIDLYADSVNTQKIASGALAYDATVYNSSGAENGSVEYLIADTDDDGKITSVNKKVDAVDTPAYLYNVNQVSNGINSVYRVFYEKFNEKSDAKKEPFIVLVDWIYAVPSLWDFSALGLLPEEASSGTATWNDVFEALYTPPAEGTPLRAWWDSNMCMSQGLTAMLFDQPRVEYVKCGYMVPQVTVLLPSGADDSYFGEKSSENVSKLLVKHGFTVPEVYSSCLNGSLTNFLGKYYEDFVGLTGSNAAYTKLKSFAKTNRLCHVIKGAKYKSTSSYLFEDGYFAEGFQVLYRNLENDFGRFDFTVKDKLLDAITLRDRVSAGSANPPVGSVVKSSVNGTSADYLYMGITTKVTDSGPHQYLCLVPVYKGVGNDLPEFKLTSTGQGKYSVVYNGKYDDWQAHVIDKFYKAFDVSRSSIDVDEWLSVVFGGEYGIDEFRLYDSSSSYFKSISKKKNLGLYHNGVLGSYSTTSSGWKAQNVAKSTKVYGVPIVYLPAGNYYVYQSKASEDWAIGTGRTGFLLNQSTLYYSGIVNGIIDAIIAKNLKTTEIGNLDSGTTILLGDTKWVKDGAYWYSYPIKNAGAASLAKWNAVNATAAFSSIAGSYPVVCDGVSIPLMNYVKSCTLSTKYLSKLPKNAICVTCDNSGKVKIVKRTAKGTKTVRQSSAALYTVFKVSFNSSLLVRPVNSDGSIYKVCDNASERVISGTQVPFFCEDLSYNDDNSVTFNLSQSGYENTATFELEKEEFNAEYQEEWYSDFKTLASMWVVVVASYLLIISWAAYLGVTKGACMWLLEAIAGRTRIDGKIKGVDVIKVMSFGIYNIDSPPKFSRCVIVTVVCLFIVAACINFV